MSYKFYLIQCADDHQCFFQENLAFGKDTLQINTNAGGVSSRAVDGKSETRYEVGNTCTHTNNVKNAWWRVDLGQEEPVSEVYIVNRGDQCCGQRLDNFEIRVGRLSCLLILVFHKGTFTNVCVVVKN